MLGDTVEPLEEFQTIINSKLHDITHILNYGEYYTTKLLS